MLKDVDLQAWSATLYRFCFSCRSSLGGFETKGGRGTGRDESHPG